VSPSLDIAVFGSSLVSAYWNGAATYYRGVLRALAARGHRITFYEPDAYGRQAHRDIPDPDWARVVVYPVQGEHEIWRLLERAQDADLLVKASGVGVFDALLERGVLEVRRPRSMVAFWDVEASATLDRLQQDPHDPLAALVPRFDLILTSGGGQAVKAAYAALGAQLCVPFHAALDPQIHHPASCDARFQSHLGLLANRLPDRETRIEEFFLRTAEALPSSRFLLGGSGWEDKALPGNVTRCGYVPTADHNAFNATPAAVLSVTRAGMVRGGFAPPARLFEAAGAAAAIVSDAWEGLELFLEPGREVLVARDGAEVVDHLQALSPSRARELGRGARRRVLAHHTYAHRAAQMEAILGVARPSPSMARLVAEVPA
jgi:spore maturation protein CgeB